MIDLTFNKTRMSSAHYGLEKRVHLLANISSLLPIPIWAYVLRSFRSEHIEVARAIGLEFSTGEIFFVGHLCVWFMHRRDRAFYAVLVSTGVTVGTFLIRVATTLVKVDAVLYWSLISIIACGPTLFVLGRLSRRLHRELGDLPQPGVR